MRITKIFISLIYLISIPLFSHVEPVRPNYGLTPGSICTTEDSDFKEFRYKERIAYCKRNVSSRTKNEIYRSYSVALNNKSLYTIDHLIPLSLGGTNHPSNLWPEPKTIKALRANLEQNMYMLVRDGKVTREDAVNEIIRAKYHPPVPLLPATTSSLNR